MKKFLFFYAVIFAFMSRQNEVQAKAVKLGRGNAYSVAADTKLNNGAGSAKVDTEKKCDSSCSTCDTATGKCIGCPTGKRPDGARCVDNCYNVTCADTKFTTVNTGTSCCCETNPDTAPDPLRAPQTARHVLLPRSALFATAGIIWKTVNASKPNANPAS